VACCLPAGGARAAAVRGGGGGGGGEAWGLRHGEHNRDAAVTVGL